MYVNTLSQCSLTSVGLAQARPNNWQCNYPNLFNYALILTVWRARSLLNKDVREETAACELRPVSCCQPLNSIMGLVIAIRITTWPSFH